MNEIQEEVNEKLGRQGKKIHSLILSMISCDYGLGTWSQPFNFPKHKSSSPNRQTHDASLHRLSSFILKLTSPQIPGKDLDMK